MLTSDWFDSIKIDLICFIFSITGLGLYQLYLRHRLREDPAYTVQAVNVIARTAWVENVMEHGKDIMAVQTLRNSTMAATFLASTAVLLVMGTLSLSGQSAQLESSWHALNKLGATHGEIWIFKLLLLMMDFFVAFFSFTMAVRLFNHVGYMINVPLSLAHKSISPRHVGAHLNRAGKYYSIGMRAFYFAVPLVFWLFSPIFMLAATAVLISVLFHIDRAPSELADDYR